MASVDLVSQALTALRLKDFGAARNFMRDYADHNPLELQHYLMLGLAELGLKEWDEARATFEDAVEDFPHQAQLWFNLGLARENLGDLPAAISDYEHCLELKSDFTEAVGNLSNLYRRTGDPRGAETMAHRAFELGAPKAQAMNSLGLAVARQGRTEAAVKIFTDALMLEPGNADILTNLANLAVDQLKFDEAWTLFAKARAVGEKPATLYHEGMARLLNGDFMRGWPLCEARLNLPNALRLHPAMPRWHGTPLAGKTLMLVAEQGYGDTIQFCRYGKLLAEQGANLVWAVRPALKNLLTANLPGQVWGEDENLPRADYWLPMLSLPLLLAKFRPEDAPPAPYLKVPQGTATYDFPADKKKIGLVWYGSASHERDYERSIPLDIFQPLFAAVPATYVAPSLGVQDDSQSMPAPFAPITPVLKDFADTASLLNSLDVLVTVDTAAAHLAGALGVRTFLLLPSCPDWRWGTSGATTPWYHRMTIIRQTSAGDWASVITDLIRQLTVV